MSDPTISECTDRLVKMADIVRGRCDTATGVWVSDLVEAIDELASAVYQPTEELDPIPTRSVSYTEACRRCGVVIPAQWRGLCGNCRTMDATEEPEPFDEMTGPMPESGL